MSDQLTTTVAAQREWSPAPALTLLAVIVLWYLGVAALVLTHAF